MARTRLSSAKDKKGGGTAEKTNTNTTTTTSSTTTKYPLPTESPNPPKVFILPNKATAAARIVTLPNPRYSKPTRFLVCPEAGFFEFTKISAPKTAPRSWLLETASGAVEKPHEDEEDHIISSSDGFDVHITKGAELYVASPLDPLFLLLPALAAGAGQESKSTPAPKKRLFLSSDDHFDALSQPTNHVSEILTWPDLQRSLELRLAAVCDTVDAGDEQMFRLNESKLLDEMLAKARRMAEHAFPKSMEEKFVSKALEAPILGVRSQPTAVTEPDPTTATAKSREGSATPMESVNPQSTIPSLATSASSLSEASAPATSGSIDSATNADSGDVVNAMSAPEEAIKLQRLRVAFNFICSSYIAPSLAELLRSHCVAAKDKVDFGPLDDYLIKLTKMRNDAAAARTSDYSRKRGMDEEEDERAEKRRKKEEEDKVKKANQSRGVKKLAKVNTTGMKKMSDFFKKK
ncbi:ribonuclease H2, subunit B [Podospora appendiculata]|uniref:Ribonuclease H2 subunit B n=1 Tax=Podospora appendiculata TaxID=314037 RepID=A0AAE1C877_9PEZI|nr:ribonuclease H2, subunit B [Podospora appendiculata]